MNQQQLLQAYLASVHRIALALEGDRAEIIDDLLSQAQVVVQGVDSVGFFYQPNLRDQQVYTLTVIQRLVFLRQDTGPLSLPIADWCLQRWLWIAQYHPQHACIMQGIGSWWLLRAQPSLARIHTIDGSSSGSSGGRSSRPGTSSANQSRPFTSGDVEVAGCSDLSDDEDEEEARALRAQRDADARLNTADYVEARGLLLPAVDYLRRAVEAVDAAGQTPTVQLLAMTAEAYMSAGNVSFSQASMDHYRQAIFLLRRASVTSGYVLPAHLQRYLEDYGRFVD